MQSKMKTQEYVLAQHGQVYKGTSKRIKGTPWNFGQVHKMSKIAFSSIESSQMYTEKNI